jgi:prolipoprotein diacylglyceryltransferase
MLFETFFLLILIGTFSFWIWMIVDCVTNEPSTGNDKIAWIIVIVFTHIIGAAIYYFVRYRPRLAQIS